MTLKGESRRPSYMPDEAMIGELVRRIVDSVQPLRIILFGSAVRGDMGPNSDLDVLVVMPEGVHRRRTAQRLYRDLLGLGFAKDIIVVTEGDVRDFAEDPSMVIRPALTAGRELYHA